MIKILNYLENLKKSFQMVEIKNKKFILNRI